MEENAEKNAKGLAQLVVERGSVTPKEAADALGIQEKEVLEWGRMLESGGIVKNKYTMAGDVTLEKNDLLKDAAKEELEKRVNEVLARQEEKEKERDKTAGEIIEELRKRIRDRRY